MEGGGRSINFILWKNNSGSLQIKTGERTLFLQNSQFPSLSRERFC